jgi:hypothetical protein
MSKVVRFEVSNKPQAVTAEEALEYAFRRYPCPKSKAVVSEFLRIIRGKFIQSSDEVRPVFYGGTLVHMNPRSERSARFANDCHGPRGRKRRRPKGAATIRKAA